MALEVQKRLRGIASGNHNSNNGTIKEANTPKPPVVRVAAYCRVSKDSDVQLGSLENQMKVFRQKIEEHPGWKLVGIYADEGITGTSVKRRKEFKRMIQDAEEGKIDYIITKGVSRFARNTLECLNYVRELKGIGVYIYFEKENIDTKSEVSEMVLTVLAAFAQEESRSISDHVKWGLRKRFEEGLPRWAPLYGYREGPDGSYVIEESEAETVRRIFQMYIDGYSMKEICKVLNDEGIPTVTGIPWTASSISSLMANERYAGNILMQKYLLVDHPLSHRIKNDQTEVPSYYIQAHHIPIISPQIFERAQQLKNMRTQHKGETSQYPYALTDLCCPFCGKHLVHRKTALHNNAYAWGCFDDSGCGKFALRDRKLNECVAICYKLRWHEDVPGRKEKDDLFGVNYGWLSEKVKSILTSETSITVKWLDGSESTTVIPYHGTESRPARLAEQYKRFVTYCPGGKYAPILLQKKLPKEGSA